MNPFVQSDDESPKNKTSYTDYHVVLTYKLGVMMLPSWILIQPQQQFQSLTQHKQYNY